MANSNLRKAAIFLLSLSKEQVDQLLSRLGPEQAAAVAAEMKAFGDVDAAEREAVVREFAGASDAGLGQRPASRVPPFQFLHDLDGDTLLNLIADEHPQTIALILSYLPPPQAAAVLAELRHELQVSVICRIATLGEPNLEVVRDLEQGLRRRLFGPIKERSGHRGVESVVEMLHVMEPAAERRLLGKLAEAEPELVREIRHAMFGATAAAVDEGRLSQVAC